jgi:hypothetical protein
MVKVSYGRNLYHRTPILYVLLFSQLSSSRGPTPPSFQVFLITFVYTPQSVGLLWTRDRLVAKTTHKNNHKRQTSMLPAGFETAIPTRDRPQNFVIDYSTIGMSKRVCYVSQMLQVSYPHDRVLQSAVFFHSRNLVILGKTDKKAVIRKINFFSLLDRQVSLTA